MSHLSVYWPDETESHRLFDEPQDIIPISRYRSGVNLYSPDGPSEDEDSPTVSFFQPTHSYAPTRESHDVISRARLLFANRQCRDCGYPVVEPIELDDALVNRSGLAVPGTATIVGFHCCGCDAEWFTSEPAHKRIKARRVE